MRRPETRTKRASYRGDEDGRAGRHKMIDVHHLVPRGDITRLFPCLQPSMYSCIVLTTASYSVPYVASNMHAA